MAAAEGFLAEVLGFISGMPGNLYLSVTGRRSLEGGVKSGKKCRKGGNKGGKKYFASRKARIRINRLETT